MFSGVDATKSGSGGSGWLQNNLDLKRNLRVPQTFWSGETSFSCPMQVVLWTLAHNIAFSYCIWFQWV